MQSMKSTFGFWPFHFRPGPCCQPNDHAKPGVEHFQLAPADVKKKYLNQNGKYLADRFKVRGANFLIFTYSYATSKPLVSLFMK